MKLHIEIAGRTRVVDYKPGSSTVTLDGKEMEAHAQMLRPGVLSLIVGGRAWCVVLDENANESAVHLGGRRVVYQVPCQVNGPRSLKSRRARSGAADGPVAVRASMPGRVVRLLAAQGQAVEAHQGIVVIEAMKMQNELRSPRSGRVSELCAAPGQTVSAGDVLAIIE